MSKSDDRRAPGEGAGEFGDQTVRTSTATSLTAKAIMDVQREITNRHAKVDGDGVVVESIPGNVDFTVEEEASPLPPPPSQVMVKPGVTLVPGVLGVVETGQVAWPDEDAPTSKTPLPRNPLLQDPFAAQRATLVVRVPGAAPVSPMADSGTMPCAMDRDEWVRFAQVLESCFRAQAPGAVSVIATSINPPSSDPSAPYYRDSLVICVLDWIKYGDLCSAESDIRRSTIIPADLKKATLLVWAHMKRLLSEPVSCLRVRGSMDSPICEPETKIRLELVQEAEQGSGRRWVLIVLVALGLVAVVVAVGVLV